MASKAPEACPSPSRHHVIIPAAGMGRRMGEGKVMPKSLRPVAGRPILLHALDALASRPVSRITLIVGHGEAMIRNAVGSCYQHMPVRYVVNEDYASTEHGWSLYLAGEAWKQDRQPVIFMDADNVFDLRLLDRLLAPGAENRVLVDPDLDANSRDEELVLGRDGRITGLVRGRSKSYPDCVGGFVGMNRFGVAFMQSLFGYMRGFFASNGRSFKYERVFHRLLSDTDTPLHYLDTGGLEWINVNHEHEIAIAEHILACTRALARSDAGADPC